MNKPIDRFDDTLIPWVGRTAKLMMIHLKQELKAVNLDLTPKQLIVLKHLYYEDGKEQTHLANITERDKTSLTRLITTMEKKGLVERRTSETDKRVNLLFITEKGRRIFEKAIPVTQDAIARCQSGVDPEQLAQAIRTMKKVHDNVKELTTQNAEI